MRLKQNQPWAPDIGYLDYVTDDRDAEYFRNYVGQATNGEVRILSNHCLNILNGHHDTLHYYIIWSGNGHRKANSVRLWTLPYHSGE